MKDPIKYEISTQIIKTMLSLNKFMWYVFGNELFPIHRKLGYLTKSEIYDVFNVPFYYVKKHNPNQYKIPGSYTLYKYTEIKTILKNNNLWETRVYVYANPPASTSAPLNFSYWGGVNII